MFINDSFERTNNNSIIVSLIAIHKTYISTMNVTRKQQNKEVKGSVKMAAIIDTDSIEQE